MSSGSSSASSSSSSSDAGVATPRVGRLTVPRFLINLDVPAAERWLEVCETYRSEFAAVEQRLDALVRSELGSTLGGFLKTMVSSFLACMTKIGRVWFADELQGIASASGLPLGQLVLLQLVYEASAHCTSIVCSSGDGEPPHMARTMDWEMDWLRPLTVEFEFQRGGETLFIAPSWAGYVGVLTVVRPGGWAAAVNFRITDSGTYWANVKRAAGSAWPVGFILRVVAESERSFDSALAVLAGAELIAPVYFTVCGVARGQGAIVTRERQFEEQRLNMSDSPTGALVQTNMDHWSDNPEQSIMWSLERRALATSFFLEHAHTSEAELWRLLSRSPIFNPITVYGSYLNPSTGRVVTIVPDERVGFAAHRRPGVMGRTTRATCTTCHRTFTRELNPAGECGHVGEWHAEYGDCSKLRCAWGLKSSIGQQHWSCCFSTARQSTCPKSRAHVD